MQDALWNTQIAGFVLFSIVLIRLLLRDAGGFDLSGSFSPVSKGNHRRTGVHQRWHFALDGTSLC
jgi:hypothetical protein